MLFGCLRSCYQLMALAQKGSMSRLLEQRLVLTRQWIQEWLDNQGGYLIGNMRTGRPDFRFYSLGNSLACLFGLLPPPQAAGPVSAGAPQPQGPHGPDADAHLPSAHGPG